MSTRLENCGAGFLALDDGEGVAPAEHLVLQPSVLSRGSPLPDSRDALDHDRIAGLGCPPGPIHDGQLDRVGVDRSASTFSDPVDHQELVELGNHWRRSGRRGHGVQKRDEQQQEKRWFHDCRRVAASASPATDGANPGGSLEV